jgi:hypothetical protein
VVYAVTRLQVSRTGTLINGINSIVTVIIIRAPGMTYFVNTTSHVDRIRHFYIDFVRVFDTDGRLAAFDV